MLDTKKTNTKNALEIKNIVKIFGGGKGEVNEVKALNDVSLDVKNNEFFTLLGPSGCGKTTLLRIIAGFESATQGSVKLFGEEINNLDANKRSINTVFQQYALFPHMSVIQNVSFGLDMLGKPKNETRERAMEMLTMVQLSDLAERKPAQLSGGQQQRVALARALAPAPKLLLLDEPLSALDLKLRYAMRAELKTIQQSLGITFVFVTHDQEEALTMSDRIAVMSKGKVQQVGTGREIYEEPANKFEADFIGETNLMDAIVVETKNEEVVCELKSGIKIKCVANKKISKGKKGCISIRPERITISKITNNKKDDDSNVSDVRGVVSRFVYLGTDTQCIVRLDDGTEIITRTQNAHDSKLDVKVGDKARLVIDKNAARFLEDEQEEETMQ